MNAFTPSPLVTASAEHQDPVRPYRFPHLPSAGQAVSAPDPQQAWQQGFDQGQEQGYRVGHEAGREAGYTDGLQQGRADGQQQGFAHGDGQGRARFDRAAAPLEALIGQLQAWQQAQRPLQRDLLLQLVSQVAQQVVQRELRQTPDAMLALVERVLDSLPVEPESLTLWLHPDDCAALAAVGVTECGGWPLRPAPTLQRGDCRIDCPDSTIESLCADRLQQSLDHVATLLAVSV